MTSAQPVKKVRVRIAPSPTGYLHIGTAHTALFNWIFAKKNQGTFILRIEDTDLERSDKKYEKDIIENLKWLGLEWDEGPYKQSERLEIYENYIKKLLADNLAYYCFCTKDELEQERQIMLTQGRAPRYSGRCRSLKTEEVKKRLAAGDSHIIRFKMPETKISFNDLIRGQISFDAFLIGDIAIAKDPRAPLYNFAVVVDDYEMKITHVIRGEDHIANSPKQIAIQKALGFPHPHYAHLPLILDLDRSKMSKRYSATAIKEYRDAGYLPEALVNFMALLGWHPQDDKEILTREEITEKFELERVQKAGAIFNAEKLDWLNSQYLKKIDDRELAKILKVKNEKIVSLVKERMKKMSDFHELAGFLLELPEYSSELLIWQSTPENTIRENLQKIAEILSKIPEENFHQDILTENLQDLAVQRGRGEIFWPLRAALSGQKTSPGPMEIAEVLGKEETLKRLRIAVKKLG